VTGATNVLLIVLDALREDAVEPSLEESGRCFKAETCISTAPWTLPSCTSLITGLNTSRHRHYWHADGTVASDLVRCVPAAYRKVGLVNNTVLLPASGLSAGFDQWTHFYDHGQPFERAAKLIRRARRRRPLFLLLHSNIAHDYYQPGAAAYYDEAFPGASDEPYILGDRVIKWSDTTPDEQAAVAKTYRASATKAVSDAREVLDLVRSRDDFVSVIVSDHGEGLDYEGARIHHGGRLHDDLLRVPLYFDLPSTIPGSQSADVADALASTPVATTDVLPTLLALAGVTDVPGVDGRRIDTASEQRLVVSEDRRYLYLNDRFRLNVKGRGKNMSRLDREENEMLLGQLAAPPILRSYRSDAAKLIVTCLHRRGDTGTRSEERRSLLELGERLLGAPVLVRRGDRLFAFELYDLGDDPTERHNLLDGGRDGLDALMAEPWGASVTMPIGDDDTEVDLAAMLEGAERL
jgi:hypothetical protein